VTTPGFTWGKLSTEGYGEVIMNYPKQRIYHELRAVIDIIITRANKLQFSVNKTIFATIARHYVNDALTARERPSMSFISIVYVFHLLVYVKYKDCSKRY